MKNKKQIAKYISFAVAVLMLALLVMQFLPFWSVEEDTVSIGGYIWMPNEHKNLTKSFRAELDDKKFDPVRIALWPVLTLVLGAIGIVMCLLKRGSTPSFLLSIGCGLASTLGFLNPLFQLGANWQIHLVVSILVLAAGIAGLVLALVENKK